MIDPRHIGHVFEPFEVAVEAGRLKFFAKATGQKDPIYSDAAAARAAGHPHLPVPPTFFMCLESESPSARAMIELLGIDYRYVLHGEQHFTYHRMAHAGDVLRYQQRVADIYTKKGGALDIAVRESTVHNQHGELVAELRGVTVVRLPQAASQQQEVA